MLNTQNIPSQQAAAQPEFCTISLMPFKRTGESVANVMYLTQLTVSNANLHLALNTKARSRIVRPYSFEPIDTLASHLMQTVYRGVRDFYEITELKRVFPQLKLYVTFDPNAEDIFTVSTKYHHKPSDFEKYLYTVLKQHFFDRYDKLLSQFSLPDNV